MQPQLPDVDSMLYIINEGQDVSINMRGVLEIAEEASDYIIRNHDNGNFNEVAYSYVRLSTEFHPEESDNRAADWLFVLNTLNFSLWRRNNMQEWRVDGLTGYLALCAAIKRAIDDGKPIWDPKYYTKLSIAETKYIFRGDNNSIIPRVFRRVLLLRNIGKVLLEKYNGTFAECIKSCKRDAIKLMITIHNTFSSYRDMATYSGRQIQLYNKAWILVTDIWAFFDSEHELSLEIKIKKYSTIFTDYRVPQVFNHFNALVYSKNFLDKFEKENKMLRYGSRQELEIRCSSLIIMKYLYILIMDKYEYFAKFIPDFQFPAFDCTCLLDNFLWDYQQIHNEQLKKNMLCKVYTEQY